MRVIAGEARRLLLKTTPGLDTRPTIDRIKETLFNIISPGIPGCMFLDLYCGSGGIGIEALSRGSSFAAFVDNNPKAVDCVNYNLEHTGLKGKSLVLKKNAIAGINELAMKKYVFDIVYMDPPYDAGLERDTLNALHSSGIINEDSLIIIEAGKSNDLDFIGGTFFEITRIKDYKANRHFFLKLNP